MNSVPTFDESGASRWQTPEPGLFSQGVTGPTVPHPVSTSFPVVPDGNLVATQANKRSLDAFYLRIMNPLIRLVELNYAARGMDVSSISSI